MRQLSEAEAVAFGEGRLYEELTPRQRAEFQMGQELLCMPFGVFHEAIESALGRPVWTHEFATNREGLRRELSGEGPAPSFEDILALIPPEKRLILVAPA